MVDPQDQYEFFIEGYPSFLGSAIYGYLFLGLDLRQIEVEYLHTLELQGFFAKAVLNLMGIDTSKGSKNKGVFTGADVRSVTQSLLASPNCLHNNIGHALLDYANSNKMMFL